MRVAITGVASRLGAELARRLQVDDAVQAILGFDRVAPQDVSGKMTFVKRDIRDPALAGVYSINVAGSANVFACAIEAGVTKLLVTSSVAAYGAFSDNPLPLSEEHPLRLMVPAFYYNRCKVLVEQQLDVIEAAHVDLTVTRFQPRHEPPDIH